MPKVKISEYSATANSNTDVASINIDEGCAPSGINNAIRAVMGHLKDFQQGTNGDPFNGPHNGTLGATTANTAVVTTLNSTDATDASSTTAAAMKTAGGLGVAKKLFVGLDSNIYGLTVGRGAGAVATNTAVGASALAANTSGGFNTAVGYQAGSSNTTGGAAITAFGYQAGKANTTGYVSAFGFVALAANTSGANNAAFGAVTLAGNTTGSFNTGIGDNALASNTTASNNTAVGYQAGYINTTGSDNTFVGKGAGYGSATGYNGNTAIGIGAGGLLGAGGNYNTFIGVGSGGGVTTGGQNTIIGAYSGAATPISATGSNFIVLSDGSANVRMYFNASGQPFYNNMRADPGSYTIRLLGSGEMVFDTSSARYKDNIRDNNYGLNAVMALQSRTFEYKNNPERTDIGLIAEEVFEVIPELVTLNKENQPDAVNYDRFISVCIKAIQELKAEVDSLKAQINGASA